MIKSKQHYCCFYLPPSTKRHPSKVVCAFAQTFSLKILKKNLPMHTSGPSYQKKGVIEIMEYWIFHLQTKWYTETTCLLLYYVHFVNTKFVNSVKKSVVSFDYFSPPSVKKGKGERYGFYRGLTIILSPIHFPWLFVMVWWIDFKLSP